MMLVADAGAGWGTGEALCAYGYGLLDKNDYEESRLHTDVVLAWIADPVLRDALEKFADVIPPMSYRLLSYRLRDCPLLVTLPADQSWYADINLLARRPLTIWTEHLVQELEQPAPRLPQAVQAIAYIQNALGLSLRQVLKAAHVRPRTYHSWRENLDRRPRLASLGRLWRLHQLTEDLVETLGDASVHRWLAEDDARLAALLRGRFDDLAAAAYSGLGGGQASARNFEGALDERESRPRMPRYPITGRKMNPGDVAGPDR
jgi:hypothetical protein